MVRLPSINKVSSFLKSIHLLHKIILFTLHHFLVIEFAHSITKKVKLKWKIMTI